MSTPGGGGAGERDFPVAPQVLNDDQLSRLSREELLQRLKLREGECVHLMKDRAQLMKDVNRTLQLHLAEVRGLREVNQALQKDNQELRDLSCFLDDDRIKARKIAKEWQKFGKYTSTVMRQEVTAYQVKLHELEQKQDSLFRENAELKELCLYLDDDREHRNNHVLPQSHQLQRSFPGEVNNSSTTRSNTSTPSKTNAKFSSFNPDSSAGHHFYPGQLTPNMGNFSRQNNRLPPENDPHRHTDIPQLQYPDGKDETFGMYDGGPPMGGGDMSDMMADVSHASSSSTSSFCSNLDSNSSNLDLMLPKI